MGIGGHVLGGRKRVRGRMRGFIPCFTGHRAPTILEINHVQRV
jgi:hypothetical protein